MSSNHRIIPGTLRRKGIYLRLVLVSSIAEKASDWAQQTGKNRKGCRASILELSENLDNDSSAPAYGRTVVTVLV